MGSNLNRWSDKDNQFIIDNHAKISFKEMSQTLNRTPKAIERRCHFLKLNNPLARNIGLQKYKRNDNYFSIPTLENSYWAGFIAADGHLHIKGQNSKSITIHLADLDEQHLESFKNCIKYNGPIRDKCSNGKILSIQSTKICNDLNKVFNIDFGNKTPILQPPNLQSNDLINAYIKGFIDGDGHVEISTTKHKEKEYNYLRFAIGCASLDMIKWICNHFCTQLGSVSKSKIRLVKNKNPYWEYILSGTQAKKVLQQLKQINTPYLNRKWDLV